MYRKGQHTRILSQHGPIGFVKFQGSSSNSDSFSLFEGRFIQQCKCWVEMISIQSNIQHITSIEYSYDAFDTNVLQFIKPNYVFVVQIQHNNTIIIHQNNSLNLEIYVKHHTYVDYYYKSVELYKYDEVEKPGRCIYM